MNYYYNVPADNNSIVPILTQLAASNDWIKDCSQVGYPLNAKYLFFYPDYNDYTVCKVCWDNKIDLKRHKDSKELSLEETIKLLSEPPNATPKFMVGKYEVKLEDDKVIVGCCEFTFFDLVSIRTTINDIENKTLKCSFVINNDVLSTLETIAHKFGWNIERYNSQSMSVVELNPFTKSWTYIDTYPTHFIHLSLESLLVLLDKQRLMVKVGEYNIVFDIRRQTCNLNDESVNFDTVLKICEHYSSLKDAK